MIKIFVRNYYEYKKTKIKKINYKDYYNLYPFPSEPKKKILIDFVIFLPQNLEKDNIIIIVINRLIKKILHYL